MCSLRWWNNIILDEKDALDKLQAYIKENPESIAAQMVRDAPPKRKSMRSLEVEEGEGTEEEDSGERTGSDREGDGNSNGNGDGNDDGNDGEMAPGIAEVQAPHTTAEVVSKEEVEMMECLDGTGQSCCLRYNPNESMQSLLEFMQSDLP